MGHIYKPSFVYFLFFFMGFQVCHFPYCSSPIYPLLLNSQFKPQFKTFGFISHGVWSCCNREAWHTFPKLSFDSNFNMAPLLMGLLTDPTKSTLWLVIWSLSHFVCCVCHVHHPLEAYNIVFPTFLSIFLLTTPSAMLYNSWQWLMPFI
jgi:hypothetical protein